MKASPRQQSLLLDLQELDNALARLRRKREQLPERAELAGLQDETSQAKQAFMEVQRELDAQQAEIARIESDVEMVRQRMQRDEELLAISSAPKEAQALQQEIETLTRRRAELEDRELEMMEAGEQTQARFAEASAVLAEVEQKGQGLQQAIASDEQAIDAELASVADERAGLSAELQRDLLEHYEQLRGRLGVGVARLRGKVSEASNMELAPAELADILAAPADELVHCPQTGAILVRVESTE